MSFFVQEKKKGEKSLMSSVIVEGKYRGYCFIIITIFWSLDPRNYIMQKASLLTVTVIQIDPAL